jgi:hypothetical protein
VSGWAANIAGKSARFSKLPKPVEPVTNEGVSNDVAQNSWFIDACGHDVNRTLGTDDISSGVFDLRRRASGRATIVK